MTQDEQHELCMETGAAAIALVQTWQLEAHHIGLALLIQAGAVRVPAGLRELVLVLVVHQFVALVDESETELEVRWLWEEE